MFQTFKTTIQNMIKDFQKLSLKIKYVTLIFAMLFGYYGIILFTNKSNTQNPNNSTISNISQNKNTSQINQPNAQNIYSQSPGSSNSAIKIPLGYPQNLRKNKSNPDAPVNVVEISSQTQYLYLRNQNQFATFGTNVDPYQIRSSNRYLLKGRANFKYSLNKEFFGITQEGKYFNQKFGSDFADIWYATQSDLTGILPVQKADSLVAPEDPTVSIYSFTSTDVNTKDKSGTYINDKIKKNTFKISDTHCKWITFKSTEFFCLAANNTKFINLSSNEVLADNIIDVVEDDDQNLFFLTLKGEVFKANLNNLKDKTQIYKTKPSENPIRLTFTNQKELLIYLGYDGGSETFMAKIKQREIDQAAAGYSGKIDDTPIKNKFTLEILPDGTTKERPEFVDYLVLI